MKWTKDKDNTLINLIKEGKDYNYISKIVGTTYNSVRCRCNKLGIKSSDYVESKIKVHECLNCGNEILDYDGRKYCSHSCSATYNNKLRIKPNYCKNCNQETEKRNIYCSIECYNNFKYNDYIEKWKNGEISGSIKPDGVSNTVRKYIFEKYDNKCSLCEWNEVNIYTNKIPLQIDHIDGNYLNNKEENLRLLCPNCHSLTENYGSRNKGNGRPYRQEWRNKQKREV